MEAMVGVNRSAGVHIINIMEALNWWLDGYFHIFVQSSTLCRPSLSQEMPLPLHLNLLISIKVSET